MNDLDDLKNFMENPIPGASPPPQSSDPGLGALQQFMAPELREEQYGTLPQQALAGAEAVGRGLTLGASDVVEPRIFPTTKEDIRARKETNPITNFAGQTAGFGTLAALTGGVALPEEAGIAATAGAGALEGGIAGLGNAVSDEALGDGNLNAQKIMTDIGLGAVLGGGVGLGVGGLKSMIGKFGGIKGTVSESIADETAAANRSASSAEAIEPMPGIKSAEAISAGNKYGLPTNIITDNPWEQQALDRLQASSPTVFGIKVRNMFNRGWDGINKVLDSFLPSNPEDLSLAKTGSIVQDGLSSKISERLEPIEELYSRIKELTPNIPLNEKLAPAISRNIMKMKEVTQTGNLPGGQLAQQVAKSILNAKTVDDIAFQKSIVREMMRSPDPSQRRVAAILADKLNNWEESSIIRHAKRLRASLADADPEKQAILEPQIKAIEDLVPQIKAAKSAYKPFIEDLGTLSKALGKNRIYGPQSALDFIESMPYEKVAQKLTAKGNSQFRSWFTEQFPQEAAILRQYEQAALKKKASLNGVFSPRTFLKNVDSLEPEIQKSIFAPDELQKINDMRTYMNAFPKNFNPSGTHAAGAFASWAASPEGMTLANLRDAALYGSIKAMRAMPESVRPNPIEFAEQLTDKANGMAGAIGPIARTTKAINDNVDHLLFGGAGSAAGNISRMGSYDDTTKRLEALANDPEMMSQHIANHVSGISGSLPSISQGVSNHMATTVMFLNSKIPKKPNNLPTLQKWQPPAPQKQKFEKYYHSVANPIDAFKQIKDSSLSSETMESLQAVHPDLLQEMRDKINSKLSPDRAIKMPYEMRKTMSMFLGRPLDSSMLQPVAAANQQFLQNPVQSQASQQMLAARPSQKGLEKLGLAKRAETETNPEEEPA